MTPSTPSSPAADTSRAARRRKSTVAPVSYASPAAFRAAIKGHMTDALGYLEGEHKRWESIGGKERQHAELQPERPRNSSATCATWTI